MIRSLLARRKKVPSKLGEPKPGDDVIVPAVVTDDAPAAEEAPEPDDAAEEKGGEDA